MTNLILYNANKDKKYKNGCVIFSTVTARSNIHDTVLSYKQIDDLYVGINQTFGFGINVNDVQPIKKIVEYLDQTYGTKTYLWIGKDGRHTAKAKRNLSKGGRGLVSITINDKFKLDVGDGTMDTTDWVGDSEGRVNHFMGLIVYEDKHYLIDIFHGAKRTNRYEIKEHQFTNLKKAIVDEYYWISK